MQDRRPPHPVLRTTFSPRGEGPTTPAPAKLSGGRMQLKVDGRQVYAATGGRTFDAAKPLIVFLHGAGMDHTVWQLPARSFAWHGYSVLAPDLPGHGRSEGPALSSVAAMAAWVAQVARCGRRARSGAGGSLHGWRHRAGGRRGIGRAHHPRGAARHGRRHPRASRSAHRRPRAARRRLPHDDGLVVRRTRQDGRQSGARPVDDRRRHGAVCAQCGGRAVHRSRCLQRLEDGRRRRGQSALPDARAARRQRHHDAYRSPAASWRH